MILATVWTKCTNVTGRANKSMVPKMAINDALLAHTPKLEIEIWRKPHKRTRSSVLDFIFDFSVIYSPICHRLAVEITSGFGKTENSVSEHRLTSNTTVTVKRRDIAHEIAKLAPTTNF